MKFFAELSGKKPANTNGNAADVALAKSMTVVASKNEQLAKAMVWQAIAPVIADAAKSPTLWNGLNRFHEASLDAILEIFGGRLPDYSNYGQDQNNIIAQILQQDAMEKMIELQQQAKSSAQSVGFSNKQLEAKGLDFIKVNSVSLSVLEPFETAKQHIASLVLDTRSDSNLMVQVDTPRAIGKALLKIAIKPIGNHPPVWEKKIRLFNVYNGYQHQVTIDQAELKNLATGDEYHLSVRLLWPNRNGARLGTAISKFILLSGGLEYHKALGSTGEVIPLNDVDQYRDFWHKVFADSFRHDYRSITMDAKYFNALDVEDDANGRLESIYKQEPLRGHKFKGKLKSGMDYSLETLNELLPMISNHPKLTSNELEALRSIPFQNFFSRVGRQKVMLEGKPNESVALWVYPEVEIYNIELKSNAVVDPNTGMVERQNVKVVQFPIPTKIHFIGTKLS